MAQMGRKPRRLRRAIPGALKRLVRRHANRLFITREDIEYQKWLARRIRERELLYTDPVERGLFSILTPVWNGSPVPYLKNLADSVIKQNAQGACEWILLDNGCSQGALRRYLRDLAQFSWVKLQRVDENLGIVRGLRQCLELAQGRYILPVDADDYLVKDALRVAASFLRQHNYPALVYTDEDKLTGGRFHQPYFKPDWDPVLFLNSAYIAHLIIVDRESAVSLGAYSDPATEGSADWDLFVRFVTAGFVPVHLPEVLYSWRIHARSTADDAANKSCIPKSQKAVLQRYLSAQSLRDKFEIRESPLFTGHSDWHFYRKHAGPKKMASIVLSQADPRRLAASIRKTASGCELIHLQSEDVQADGDDWPWEAIGLFELHNDAVMVGGRIRNRKGLILSAGCYFGFGGQCGSPYRGKEFRDCGYFTHLWKQRSVSAVSTQFCVVKRDFLLEVLEGAARGASLAFLGAWAGAHALRTGRRIIYTPFMSAVSDLDWDCLPSAAEQQLFAEINSDLLPDQRFYSRHLSLKIPFALPSRDECAIHRVAAL
jgi:glycosyltransferase involved in cell wall biosynthesis